MADEEITNTQAVIRLLVLSAIFPLLLFPFVFLKQDITRIWGFVLTALYMVYVIILLA